MKKFLILGAAVLGAAVFSPAPAQAHEICAPRVEYSTSGYYGRSEVYAPRVEYAPTHYYGRPVYVAPFYRNHHRDWDRRVVREGRPWHARHGW